MQKTAPFSWLDIPSREELLPLLLSKEKANRFALNESQIVHQGLDYGIISSFLRFA